MESSNGQQGPSHAPDFKDAFRHAQETGDFDFVLQTAKDSDKMLREFKEAIHFSSFPGKHARAIAMGTTFLDNMIAQSASQLESLKRTEKLTREAIKAAQAKSKAEAAGPEAMTPAPEAAEPVPQPTAPQPAPHSGTPLEALDPKVEEGWEKPPEGGPAAHV